MRKPRILNDALIENLYRQQKQGIKMKFLRKKDLKEENRRLKKQMEDLEDFPAWRMGNLEEKHENLNHRLTLTENYPAWWLLEALEKLMYASLKLSALEFFSDSITVHDQLHFIPLSNTEQMFHEDAVEYVGIMQGIRVNYKKSPQEEITSDLIGETAYRVFKAIKPSIPNVCTKENNH